LRPARLVDAAYTLASFIDAGDFRVAVASRGSFRAGDGVGKPLAIRLMSTSAELAVLLGPDLSFAESVLCVARRVARLRPQICIKG
jgi:hypothetical protein